MDASAYIEHPQWLELLKKLNLLEESMCEDRYHHVVHMVSAANGAEDFYSVDGHEARYFSNASKCTFLLEWHQWAFMDVNS